MSPEREEREGEGEGCLRKRKWVWCVGGASLAATSLDSRLQTINILMCNLEVSRTYARIILRTIAMVWNGE